MAKAARRASPSATSSTPRAPVAEATSRSVVIPPVPRSCAAIMRSAFEGPPRTRTRPSATVNRMKPAAASRYSVMAECPHEQDLFFGQIGCDRLVDVEAVDKECAVLVNPGWQRSRQQTGQGAERAPRTARGQPQRIGDEARTQRQIWIEGTPRNVRSGNHRLTDKAQSERRKKNGPRPRSSQQAGDANSAMSQPRLQQGEPEGQPGSGRRP